MNWLTKLVSLFTGEDEKQYEKNEVKSHEDANVRNVLSSPTNIEDYNKTHPKAEARVAYQYPKGNFRFPIIPDEKYPKRQERPRRPSPKKEQVNHREKEPTSSNRSSYRPINKYSNQKMDEGEKTKRPFHPTAIPSPVYGFQTREERIQGRPQLFVEKNGKVEQVHIEKEEPVSANVLDIDQTHYGIGKKHHDTYVEDKEKNEHEVYQDTKIFFTEEQEDTLLSKEDRELRFEVNETKREETKQINMQKGIPEEINSLEEVLSNDRDYIESDVNVVEVIQESEETQEFEEIEEIVVTQGIKETNELESLQEFQITHESEETEETEESQEYNATQVFEGPEEADQVQETQENDLFTLLENATPDEEVDELPEIQVASAESEVYSETPISGAQALDFEVFDAQDVPNQHINTDHVSSSSTQVAESNSSLTKQANNRQQNTAKVEKHQVNNSRNSKSALPFNVMMLGRDKQRMREKESSYQFPSLSYLNVPEIELLEDDAWLNEQRELLDVTLKNFNVRANVVNVTQGPSVTRFEVHPEPGVKVNKITNLSDDIKLSLAAKDIRIEAPIPGKNTIGIEVPNKVSKMVYLREILRSPEFRTNPSPMTAVLGLDISGQPAVTDLKKMPHGLIAGATGSGKSVCINTILVSLLYKASPQEVKLMLIDPKMVELAPYNGIPHLVSPVITDVKAATAALKWAVEEMERRYELFAHSGTREITRYNQLVKEHKQGEHLPYLVIVIDELADLMMVAPNDVEEAICRIAQKARACGIHLIVATQRPSVDVITGLIKANIPTRIAFSVSSQVDSRTIIDVNGAEKLLGKGDMLFLENGSSKAVRLQGTFVSDEEIERVVKHVKHQAKPDYLFHQDELVKKATIQSEEDELFLEACEFVVNQGGASTSLLQRRFRIGYNRAARLIDMMEDQGIISENRGSKPRDILISEEELDSIHEGSTY